MAEYQENTLLIRKPQKYIIKFYAVYHVTIWNRLDTCSGDINSVESKHVFIVCILCIANGDHIVERGKVYTPFTGFSPPHFVPVPSHDLDFQLHILWSFVCRLILRSEVIVLCVDIG